MVAVIAAYAADRDAWSQVSLDERQEAARVTVGWIGAKCGLKGRLGVGLASLPAENLRQTGERFRIVGIGLLSTRRQVSSLRCRSPRQPMTRASPLVALALPVGKLPVQASASPSCPFHASVRA